MKPLPSLKQLEYLVALSETRHFGRAANRCHVTQSTISAGIRDLENVLGVAVAERSKRQVLLTPLGLTLAEHARALLSDAKAIVELASSNREPMAGDMRLGVIPTIGPYLLPKVMPALARRYPSLKLYLREEQTEPLLARLRSGEIDVALIALPYDLDGLESLVLLEDEFQFACSRKHPLAEDATVSPDVIAGEPLMLLEEGHCLRGHALDVCHLGGKQLRALYEASSLQTLVQMVGEGLGVTLIPGIAIDAGITRGTNVKLIPLAERAFRQIGLVWRRTSLRKYEFQLLGDALRGETSARKLR